MEFAKLLMFLEGAIIAGALSPHTKKYMDAAQEEVAQLEAENKALRANVSKSVLRRLDIQLAASIKEE